MRKFRTTDLSLELGCFVKHPSNGLKVKRIRPMYQYVDGKKTDNIIGSYIDVVDPSNENVYLPIKIMGETSLNQTQIDSSDNTFITLDGLTFTFYTNSKGYPDISLSADSFKIVTS